MMVSFSTGVNRPRRWLSAWAVVGSFDPDDDREAKPVGRMGATDDRTPNRSSGAPTRFMRLGERAPDGVFRRCLKRVRASTSRNPFRRLGASKPESLLDERSHVARRSQEDHKLIEWVAVMKGPIGIGQEMSN